MYDQEVQKILDKSKIFDKLYGDIRFVDPVAKKVISYHDNTLSELAIKCFDFWEKNKICDNCVSVRAYNENKIFIKIEYTPKRVFMVTAIPFDLEDRKIVIELLKDATDSMIYDYGEHESSSEIYSMIHNMNNLILKDPLTGIYNRRYINEKLPIDIVNAALSGQDISIIMADIDIFKKVNDTYGHLAGDEVIKNFAGTISGCIKRESDWVSRFGGEEILICMPGAKLEKAVEIAEKMRKQVEDKEIIFNNKKIRITASFGVNTIKPIQSSNLQSFIEGADKMLYLAKNNGRNRVGF
ncbi:MAG: GGDEF domain-containing protein [Clostridiaceae bacterium]